MANTYVDYTATAAQQYFAFNFPYLEDEHVVVEIEGVDQTITTNYTIETSPTQRINLSNPTTALAGGELVRIKRRSAPNTNLVDFQNGSVLTESELDRAYLHNRYLAEEATEGADSGLKELEGSTNYNAGNKQIKNLADGTLATDAVNKGYVDTQIALTDTNLAGFYKSTHTGNGTDNVFTLSFTPQTTDAKAYIVSIDGLVQVPDTDYTIGATAITFNTIPSNSAEICVVATAAASVATVNEAQVTALGTSDTRSLATWTRDLGTPIATGSTTARSLADRFADVVNVLDYGATGDGVTDDTTAIQNAASAATAASKPLYAPAGTYRMTTGITVTHGLIGDGPSDTIFQGVDDGTVKGSLISTTTSGTGLYSGFTLDGACSADPVAWDSSNYDSFTGHQSVFNCGGNKIVISNVVSQNSFFAPFRCELGDNVLFENCKAIRGRGNFGDGYYIRKSHNVTLINCMAEDVTRIGFVCEGDNSRICENVTFIGCHAENAHDQSNAYGGNEFNAGFWFENSTLNTCIGCTAKDTDDGFLYVGTFNVSGAGHSVAKGTFINCYAETLGYGFFGQSLIPTDIETILTFDNCSVKNSEEAFLLKGTTATLNSCSFTKDGGTSQTRTIQALEGASLVINGFYENWTNKPAADLDPNLYAGSISVFGASGPAKEIVVDGYRTYNDAYFTIKFVNSEHRGVLDLTVKNAVIRCPVVNANSIKLDNCIIEDGNFYFSSDLYANNSTFTGNLQTFLYTNNSFVNISNCKFERANENNYLYFFNQENTSSKLKYFINNSSFVGNVETGYRLIHVNTATALASTSRCADIAMNGCTFFNTGGSTTNTAIVLSRGSGTSAVYATSVWKSASITNLATALGQNSTVFDR